MKQYKRTLVTCALPYANGPVHIGHLAGAYIPGDIYVRYLRMRGEDVLFICGSAYPSPSRRASRASLPRTSWTSTTRS